MKKNWFKRHLHWTFVIVGGLLYSFFNAASKVASRHPEHPEYGDYAFWITALVLIGEILLIMWALIQKGRSLWWLFLVVPLPVAYFFMKNKSAEFSRTD